MLNTRDILVCRKGIYHRSTTKQLFILYRMLNRRLPSYLSKSKRLLHLLIYRVFACESRTLGRCRTDSAIYAKNTPFVFRCPYDLILKYFYSSSSWVWVLRISQCVLLMLFVHFRRLSGVGFLPIKIKRIL